MAIQYAPLFALETQFQTKDGRNNTGGWLKVFLAATDDPATTYSDYNGTRNPEKIVLDDDGRALVICDKSKAYRLEVYSIDGTLLWTEEPVYCSGTGGGGVSITKVVSTDGSISVDKNVAGSTTTYDLGIANSSDEFLEWIKCSENECGATWYPVFQDGTMETEAGQGIKVHKGHLYHFTNSFTVDPDGTGVNYDTFHVAMYCGDAIVDERDFDIDSSLNDPVLCEFSRDVVPSEDSHVYFKLTIPATCKASGEVQCHRIYSGINAVPDTCATKQWVSGSFQPLSGMSAYVPYSSVGNNGMGQVTGINGSAIVGGLDSASVSSIASSVASAYTESAFSSLSSKADSSSLTAYQPVSAMGAYTTTSYVDGMVSGKLDTTAFNSADFYPTSNPSGFITGVDLGGYATTGFVESAVSGKLDTSAFSSASAGFQPTGDYAYNSALTAYIPASASGAFQPSGDYAFNSAVSSKLDASASSNFVMDSSMTSWIPYSALGYSGTAISGIGGSSLAGMGGGGVAGDYVEKSAMEVAIGSNSTAFDIAFAQGGRNSASSYSFAQGYDNSARSGSFAQGFRNSANNNSIAQGSSNTATSDSIAQGQHNTATIASFAQGQHNTVSRYSFAQGFYNSASSYSFAQGNFNSASSHSFAQGQHNTATHTSFAQGDGNSADSYSFAQGDGNSANSYSFAQGNRNSAAYTAAVFGKYNLRGNGSTITGDSAAFAIGDGTSNTDRHDLMLVTKNGEITMYSSTADTVGLGLVSSIKAISAAATGGVDSATVSAIASAYAESAASGKLDSSASSMFQPSGKYQTAGDYAYNSSVSSKLDASASSQFAPSGNYADKSALSYYVPVSASGQFAPSGDYAYNSALNGKQDTLAFGYNTANQISSINGSALGGMDGAAVSGIASAYAQSAASSKLDKTAQVVTATGTASAEDYGSWPLKTSYLVSSINGSALLPYGYSALSGYSADWTSVYNTVSRNSASWSVVSPSGTILVTNGNEIEGTNSAVYTARDGGGEGFTSLLTPNMPSIETYMQLLTTGTVPGPGATLSIPLGSPPWTSTLVTLSGRDSNYNYASASGLAATSNTIAEIPMGGITGEISASADQYLSLSVDGSMLTAHSDGGIITTGVAELAWKSAVDNVTNTVATKLDSSAFNSGDFYSTSNPSGFITGVDLTPYQTTAGMSAYATTAFVESGLSGKENVFSAGVGLEFVQSGSDRVLQVEAPVDIVAGPGIVIDNPDGNTLRVSQASNYEVELYSHTSVAKNAVNTVLNMNEPVTNFERIRVECWNREFQHMRRDFEFTLTDSTTSTQFIADMDASRSVDDQQRINLGFGYNSDGNLVDLFHGLFYGNGSKYTNANDRGLGIHRVVGIHRIAGGN